MRRRHRSAAYRARRRVREARRHLRASERRDYQTMLQRTPGYADWLDRLNDEIWLDERRLEEGAS